MKISIVTICYNNETEIRETIESVARQTYKNIEYIIVDGASKDGTISIVSEYRDKISKIISEPDRGIYDALNKGIKNATGDVIGFIHAGDKLYEETTIEKIAKFFESNEVDISYGGSKTITPNGDVVRLNPGLKEPYKTFIRLGWMPSHMSMYTRREVFDKYGMYREDMGLAGDYEWFIRYFYKHGDEFKIKCISEYILYFSLGGVSSQDGIKKIQQQQKELLSKCWLANDIKPICGLVYFRLIWAARIIIKGQWAKLTNKA